MCVYILPLLMKITWIILMWYCLLTSITELCLYHTKMETVLAYMEHSLMYLVKGTALAQETPWSISQPKGDSFAPEGEKAGSKKQRQETQDKGEGKGTRKRGKGYLSWMAKDWLWIEMRQSWPIGKWKFVKIKGETQC